MKVGTTNSHPSGSGGHPPRVARLELVDTAGGVHSLLYSTSDNCSDNGHISTAGDTITLSEITSAWTASDASTDSPANYLPDGGTDGAGGVTRGNYCTWNPLAVQASGHGGFRTSNLEIIADTAGSHKGTLATMAIPSTGKWYFEVEAYRSGAANNGGGAVGVAEASAIEAAASSGTRLGEANSSSWVVSLTSFDAKHANTVDYADYLNGGTVVNQTAAIGVAVDMDNDKMWMSYDGTWGNAGGTGNPATGANPAFSGEFSGKTIFPAAGVSVDSGSGYLRANFGQRAFKNAAPTGFSCLCTQNLPDLFGANSNAAEDKNTPSKYFDILTFTGTGNGNGNQKITFPFSPDFVWTKQRNAAASHGVYDRVRGTNSKLYANTNAAANTNSNAGPASWDSDGVTLDDTGDDIVYNGGTGIAFAWDAGTAANTSGLNDGTINISSGDQWVNSTAGFSITKYSGNGTNNATVSHGLSTIPDFIMIKNFDTATSWAVWHNGLSTNHIIFLEDNSSSISAPSSGYVVPVDSSVIKLVDGSSNATNVNTNGDGYIMYSWRNIPQFSAFGTLEGNGNSNGPFCYTGMTPSWILFKNIDSSQHWQLVENVTDTLNPGTNAWYPNMNNAMETNSAFAVDFLSNGFKIRNTNSTMNTSGHTYVYAAFTGTNPFKTARAR
tara:strand:+ start:184 stop:2184 length:2001 start_codon:yes stop_codon:yes gene_type:complete